MKTMNIIVIGASAGGVEALTTLVQGLPAEFSATIFIALHCDPRGPSLLPGILERAGHLPVAHAKDQEKFEPGRIYIAPPGLHMVIVEDRISLNKGAKLNYQRPAIDPLFRSAAKFHGPSVIGVILTGCLDDGTAGLMAIKRCGGLTVVQNPDDARYPEMPRSALAHVEADHVSRIDKLAGLLILLTKTIPVVLPREPVDDMLETETRIEARGTSEIRETDTLGKASTFVCPECNGTLWELRDVASLRYRCHTGHSFTEAGLIAEKDEALERALWNALRALEEKAVLNRRLSHRLKLDAKAPSENLADQVSEAERNINSLREILLTGRI